MTNWEQHEQEAAQAIASAATSDALEEVRVRYLGRKSELALALREVRDRESGMLLNGIRQRLVLVLLPIHARDSPSWSAFSRRFRASPGSGEGSAAR